jgi:hypothetical protein
LAQGRAITAIHPKSTASKVHRLIAAESHLRSLIAHRDGLGVLRLA